MLSHPSLDVDCGCNRVHLYGAIRSKQASYLFVDRIYARFSFRGLTVQRLVQDTEQLLDRETPNNQKLPAFVIITSGIYDHNFRRQKNESREP